MTDIEIICAGGAKGQAGFIEPIEINAASAQRYSKVYAQTPGCGLI